MLQTVDLMELEVPLPVRAAVQAAEEKRVNNPEGRGSQKGTSFSPEELSAKHKKIVRYSAAGMTGRDIAKEVGCSQVVVSYVLKSRPGEEYQNYLQGLAEMALIDEERAIREMSPAALATVADIMFNGEEKNRLKAAETLLDRNPATSKHTSKSIQQKGANAERIAGWKEEFIEEAERIILEADEKGEN